MNKKEKEVIKEDLSTNEDVQNDSTKEKTTTKNPSILTTVLVGILTAMVVVFGILVFKKLSQTNKTYSFAYVCEVQDNNIIAFDATSREMIYLEKNDEMPSVDYGDEVKYTYKKKGEKDNYTYYKNVTIDSVDKKKDNYWPATKDIRTAYSYNYAMEKNDIIIESETISSGQDVIAKFEQAVKDKKPYYIRITDFCEGDNTIITDVMFDGDKFYTAEDSTINDSNTDGKRIVTFKEFAFFEQYEYQGVMFNYLTNTPNCMENAIKDNLFATYLQEDGSSSASSPIDIYWLYYDTTNYKNAKASIEVDENNTLTFEDGKVPCPKLNITYQHYFNKDIVVSGGNSNSNNTIDYSSLNDANVDTNNNTNTNTNTNNSSKSTMNNIVLEKVTNEVEARDIHIEKDGKVYNQVGLGTLEKDLSGNLFFIDETDTFTIELEKGYGMKKGHIKVYSYSDLENEDAKPIKEIDMNEKTIEVNIPSQGVFIYEVTIEDDGYNARYVFFINKQI